MSSDTDTVDTDQGTDAEEAEGYPLRIVASHVAAQCRAIGVRPPTLRTLRYWRDQGIIDPPGRLGFTAKHFTQAEAAARARAAGASLDAIRDLTRRRAAATAPLADDVNIAMNAVAAQPPETFGMGASLAASANCAPGSPILGGLNEYNGPHGCITYPGLPSSPSYPWDTYPTTVPTIYPGTGTNPYPTPDWSQVLAPRSAAADLDLVRAALDEGDADGALEHLDAVIHVALRDPSEDLAALRALRARLEDVIAGHRSALADIAADVPTAPEADDESGTDAADPAPTEAGVAQPPAHTTGLVTITQIGS